MLELESIIKNQDKHISIDDLIKEINEEGQLKYPKLNECYKQVFEHEEKLYKDKTDKMEQKHSISKSIVSWYKKNQNPILTFFFYIPFKISDLILRTAIGENNSVKEAELMINNLLDHAKTVNKQLKQIEIELKSIAELEAKKENKFVLWGKQQITTVADFINNKLPINIIPEFKDDIALQELLEQFIALNQKLVESIKNGIESYKENVQFKVFFAGYQKLCDDLESKVNELQKLRANSSSNPQEIGDKIVEAQKVDELRKDKANNYINHKSS